MPVNSLEEFLRNAERCRVEGNLPQAIDWQKRASRLAPNDYRIACNLGSMLKVAGEYAEARKYLQYALSLKDDPMEARYNLGMLHIDQSRLDDAISLFEPLIEKHPDFVPGLFALGLARHRKGDLAGAVEVYCRAHRAQPENVDVCYNLGVAFRDQKQLDPAKELFLKAKTLNPDLLEADFNLAESCLELGELKEAEGYYAKLIRGGKAGLVAWSSFLLCRSYNPAYDPEEILQSHREFGKSVASQKLSISFGRTESPRLRIGYVSPDFNRHPAGSFLLPLLQNHDHSRFEIHCFSDTRQEDARTQVFRSCADGWHSVADLKDDAVARLIQKSGIQILVDCAGHTASNRLGLFSRKPVPLQVTTGFAYPETTGLEMIQYKLTDTIVHPDDGTRRFEEEPLFLSPCFCCYSPTDTAPDCGDLPAGKNGFITFGSTHKPARISEETVRLWSSVLTALPESRMLIFRDNLAPSTISRIKGWFSRHGVGPDRLNFECEVPGEGHWAVYRQIDLLLDTQPWSGHTTACESLWMGVPVMTLEGARCAGRMVASLLHCAGLPEFVAEDPSDFVGKAVRGAMNRDHLAELRAGLREKVRLSPLCDGGAFAACVEEACRRIWDRHIAELPGK